jgi:hypothetical protein
LPPSASTRAPASAVSWWPAAIAPFMFKEGNGVVDRWKATSEPGIGPRTLT